MEQVTASTETRLQALEGNKSECEHHRLDCAGLIIELATLNANIKALTEAMLSHFTICQHNPLQKSNLDADKAPAKELNIDKTVAPTLPPAVIEPDGTERTRCYTRVHTGSRSKEVAKATTPPPVVFNAEDPGSDTVRTLSDRVEATHTDEGQGASTSPGSDCVPISPPTKARKPAIIARRRPTSNARGKAAAKVVAVEEDEDYPPASDTALAAPPSKRVGN